MTRIAQEATAPSGDEPNTSHDIILDVTDLVKHYGAVRALDSATFVERNAPSPFHAA